jgi:hypothetical protein
VLLQFSLVSNSVAGPPLVTDDPGILDPGAWEVINAVAGEDRSAGNYIHTPLLDISLGLTSNTQLSVLLPYTIDKPEGGSSNTGLTYASLAYKWRISSTPKWEWALAANYTLPVSNQIIRANGPEDIRVLSLPVLVSRTMEDWTWNGQVGWNVGSDGDHFWDYGLAVSHPLGNSLQGMMEVFGVALPSFEQSTLNFQLGLDYEITPALHFLTSAGSRIRSESGSDNRLNYSYYFGLQWFH